MLITRPICGALQLAKRCIKCNINYHIDSLANIAILTLANYTIKQYQIMGNLFIIITSQYALNALLNFKFTMPIFLVGLKLKKKILELGYKNILFCGDNIKILRDYIINNYSNINLLYLRGNVITENLVTNSNFYTKNISIFESIVYKTIYSNKLQNETIFRLKNNHIKYIILFSLKIAEIFFFLIEYYGLFIYLKNILYITLSDKIADYINFYIKDSNKIILIS